MRLWKGRDAPIGAPSVLTTIRLAHHEALVVSKSRPGFDSAAVDEISSLLRSIADGEFDRLKFLVFDFAHGDEAATDAAEGFSEMVSATAELIVSAPVITLAWARSLMAGPDFDLALHCSAIIAESGARFYFGGNPFDLFGLYAALGRKIGFVKVERLIESDAMISAAEALELMIVKDVVAPQSELAASDAYLTQLAKRHNASYAIFRAQRLAQPPLDRRSMEAMPR
jgi:enoyl-CoA hydratase/carnithine racemase